MRRVCLLFLFLFLFLFRPPSASATEPSSRGEIRMVILGHEIPPELTRMGLVRFDSAGRIAPGLASRWSMETGGRVWQFRIPLSRFEGESGAAVVSLADVASAVREGRDAGRLPREIEEIRTEGESLVLHLAGQVPTFLVRLASPGAGLGGHPGLGGPVGEAAAPFRLVARDTGEAVLAANPRSSVAVRAETLVILFEDDPARAVFLVESGRAEIAPVGDEDLVRLQALGGRAARLVPGARREIHVLLPGMLESRRLRRVAQAIDREQIVRFLLSRRGAARGSPLRPLQQGEAATTPAMTIAVEGATLASNRRLVRRIAYEIERMGIECRILDPPAARAAGAAPGASATYAVFPDGEVPAGAIPLFAVTPYWLVSERVENFAPPRPGAGGVIEAFVRAGGEP